MEEFKTKREWRIWQEFLTP